jgi:CRISPR-associated protein Csm2
MSQDTRQQPRGQGRTPPQEIQQLPPFSIGKITPELFSETAKSCAKVIADNGGRDRNKATQLRRFYDEICLWHEKIGNDKTRFDENLPFIHMLAAKVAYANGRKLVDDSFLKLIETCLKEVTNLQTFNNFKFFMEAFMGFYKMYKPQ